MFYLQTFYLAMATLIFFFTLLKLMLLSHLSTLTYGIKLDSDSQAQEGKVKGQNRQMENTLTLTGYRLCPFLPSWIVWVIANALRYVFSVWLAVYGLSEEDTWTLAEFVDTGRFPFIPTFQLLADIIWIGVCPSFFIDPLPFALILDLHSPSTSSRTVHQSHSHTICTMAAREHLIYSILYVWPEINLITCTYTLHHNMTSHSCHSVHHKVIGKP